MKKLYIIIALLIIWNLIITSVITFLLNGFEWITGYSGYIREDLSSLEIKVNAIESQLQDNPTWFDAQFYNSMK